MFIKYFSIICLMFIAYWLGCQRISYKYHGILIFREELSIRRYIQNKMATELFIAKLVIIFLFACLALIIWRTVNF